MIVKSKRAQSVVTWALMILYPFAMTAVCEFIACSGKQTPLKILGSAPQRFLPALVFIGIFFAFMVCATRRPWIACLVSGFPCLLFSIINYFKMQYSVIPFIAGDLVFAKSVGDVTAEFTGNGLVVPPLMVLGVVFWVIYALAFAMLGRNVGIFKYARIWVSGVLSLLLVWQVFVFAPLTYKAVGIDINSSATAAVSLKQNGFITTFLKTVYGYFNRGSSADVSVSEEDFAVNELMTDKPNVIVVLAEAYWDPKQLTNISFSENPTETYDMLCAEGVSGTILSPTIGGGTVRCEFEVLTSLITDDMPEGNSAYDFITTDYVPSLGSYFKQNGYETTFMHTYEKTFYDRDKAYPLMGFDNMYDIADIPYEYTKEGGYVPDSVLGQWVTDRLADSDEPQFIMAISIENHGPYYDKDNHGEVEITNADELDEETANIVSSFSKSVQGCDNMLRMLYDYAEESGEPTVILWYGDHLPYFGSEYHAYVGGGFIDEKYGDEANWDEEMQDKMHSTPFLIWSNTGTYEPQSGIKTAPYLLGQLLLKSMDAPLTDFYKFSAQYSDESGPVRAWTETNDISQIDYDTIRAYTDIFLYQ